MPARYAPLLFDQPLKMTRVITKIGDVFVVVLDNKTKKFFQYITNDICQLNSSVIRVFKTKYNIELNLDCDTIVEGAVDFYAHCVLRWGIKSKVWTKIGNCKATGTEDIFFRDTNDFGHKLGEEPIKISENWYIWKVNDEKFTRVGKLEQQYQHADLGMVMPAHMIVDRMQNGGYNIIYPGF